MTTLNSTVRILIIDDDEDDFYITKEYIQKIPGRNFIIDWCPQYKEALHKICEGKYDLYFADYLLGPETGLDLIKNAMKNQCAEPIILLTGKGNLQVDLDAMNSGAFDYLIKPDLSVEKLERSIRYALEKTASLKALRMNERKFRSFFEKSKDAVFLADENLYFKDANSAMTELFDLTKDELCEISLYTLLANKPNQTDLENLLQTENLVDDKEIEFLSRNSEKIVGILSVSKEKNIQGEPYIQGIIHDITDLKKAEKAKLQAEKLEATGRLARILAHEIRNPLNNINLSVEQLNSEIDPEESKIYLDIIYRNSKTINDLITELLNTSKPTESILKKMPLQQILNDAISKAEDRMKLKKIQFKVEYPQKESFILADTEKLKIAFLNIIINAIEAVEEGTGRLLITVTENTKDLIVVIEDNGSGISNENLSRLFVPYFTSKKNGLGLGLAATLNILQSHESLIEVQSSIDQGTTFTLSFKKA